MAPLSVHVGWWEGGWGPPSLWRLCCLLTLIQPQARRGRCCRPGYGRSLQERLVERTPFTFLPMGCVLQNCQGSRGPTWALRRLGLGLAAWLLLRKGSGHFTFVDTTKLSVPEFICLSEEWVVILINTVGIMLRMINKSIFIYSGQDVSSEPRSTNQAGRPCTPGLLAGVASTPRAVPLRAGGLRTCRTPCRFPSLHADRAVELGPCPWCLQETNPKLANNYADEQTHPPDASVWSRLH